MARYRMTHYFYAPMPPADSVDAWKKPIQVDTLKMLTALIKSCAERRIDFNYGLHLPSTFQAAHAFQQDVKTVAANLALLVTAGCKSFSVIFADGDDVNVPIAEGGKNLGVLHAEALNVLMEILKGTDKLSPLQFFVAPAHRHGDLQYEKALPKKHLYYWRDMNTNLHADAVLLYEGAEQLNERVSHNFAAAVWQYWGPKRKVVFWDRYPANDFAPQAIFLQPYEGRALGLENYFYGTVCSVMLQPRLSLATVSTVFSYLHAPMKYVPLKALKDALTPLCLGNARALGDLLTLIAICPSPIAAVELSETAVRFAKGAAPAVVAEVETALKHAQEASYATGIKEELAPMFSMCNMIIQLNSHKHALRALLRQEELEKDEKCRSLLQLRIESAQGAALLAQRQLDALLWRK